MSCETSVVGGGRRGSSVVYERVQMSRPDGRIGGIDSGVVDAIPLRAHNLLCLLGFRGEGYSVGFVREMWAVHRSLASNPRQRVLVLDTPDRLCGACPNLRLGGCTLQGPEHEKHMRSQDRDVLARLGLEAGESYEWVEVLTRIATRVRGADLPDVCTTCPWLHLGWCAEGLERLRAETAAAAAATEPAAKEAGAA